MKLRYLLGTALLALGGSCLWTADADHDVNMIDGTLRWGDKAIDGGTANRLTIVNDPAGRYGKVYRAYASPKDLASGATRAEFAESSLDGQELKLGVVKSLGKDTRDVYIGWRSRIGSGVFLHNDSNDGNYLQLKGDASTGGPAIGLTIRFNRLALRSENFLSGTDGTAWLGPQIRDIDDEWHQIVLHVVFSSNPSVGTLEVWFDGVRQKLSNGATTIHFPTMNPTDTYIYPKMGVYSMDVEGSEGSSGGPGPYHWFDNVRIGYTYAEAVPR